MTTILQIVLWLLAGIGLIFVLIIIVALVLATEFKKDSPAHDGRLVKEGAKPVSGSEAQDSSRREVVK